MFRILIGGTPLDPSHAISMDSSSDSASISVLKALVSGYLHHDGNQVATFAKVADRVCVFVAILLVYVFKVEMRCEVGHHYFHCRLCECLSEADPFTTVEWCPCKRMSLFSSRC